MNTDRNRGQGIPPDPDKLTHEEQRRLLAWLEFDDVDAPDVDLDETVEPAPTAHAPAVSLPDDVRRMISRQVTGATRARAAVLRLPGFDQGGSGRSSLTEGETPAMLAEDGEPREFTVRWRRSTEVDDAIVLRMEDRELSGRWEPITLTAGAFTWPHTRRMSQPLEMLVPRKWLSERKPTRPATKDPARADGIRVTASPETWLHAAAKRAPGENATDEKFADLLINNLTTFELTAYADACGESTAIAAVDVEWPTDAGLRHITQILHLRTDADDVLAHGRLVGSVRLEMPWNVVLDNFRATVRDLRPDDLAWFTPDDLIGFLPDQDLLTHLPLEPAEGGWRCRIRHDFQRDALASGGGQALLRLVPVTKGGAE